VYVCALPARGKAARVTRVNNRIRVDFMNN
jgi:hypothetical protein